MNAIRFTAMGIGAGMAAGALTAQVGNTLQGDNSNRGLTATAGIATVGTGLGTAGLMMAARGGGPGSVIWATLAAAGAAVTIGGAGFTAGALGVDLLNGS